MKRFLLILPLLIWACLLHGISIIPLPCEYETLQGFWFVLNERTRIEADQQSLEPLANDLAATFQDLYGIELLQVKRPKQHIVLTIDPEMVHKDQGYFLSVGEREIVITGHDVAGVHYGILTLLQTRQTLPRAESQGTTCQWPIMIVDDSPQQLSRALTIDVGRQKISADSLCRVIRLMGQYKLNVLYVNLINVAQWLSQEELPQSSMPNAPFTNQATSQSELFIYTNQEWDTINSTARRNFITVIPTVDISQLASTHSPLNGEEPEANFSEQGIEQFWINYEALVQAKPQNLIALYQKFESLDQRFKGSPSALFFPLSQQFVLASFPFAGSSNQPASKVALPLGGTKVQWEPFFKPMQCELLRLNTMPAWAEVLWSLPELLDIQQFTQRESTWHP